jgi:DNA-directed RNA polymerase specialized sigma24 family protein
MTPTTRSRSHGSRRGASLRMYGSRASFRARMYRIVTNTCLDMLKARARRVMPQDVCPPIVPGPPTTAPRSDILFPAVVDG